MRCKVGDLAVIVRCGIKENIGMMVEVIAVAPTHDFSLPNGARHRAADPGQWVVKTIGSPLILRREREVMR